MAEIGIADKATLDTVNANVGRSSDAASSNGSLHAKIAELRANSNSLMASLQKTRGPVAGPGYFSTTSSTYVTALNISGSGKLMSILAYTTQTANSQIKVTCDGVVVSECTASFSDTGKAYPTREWIYSGLSGYGYTADGQPYYAIFEFKNSLRIDILRKNGTSGATVTVAWQYVKD